MVLPEPPRGSGATPVGNTENPPDSSARTAQGLGGYTRGCARAHPSARRKIPCTIPLKITRGLRGSCLVHKPGVPQGPASTPGLGRRKQHVVHGPAQESKNTTGRKDSPVADRKVYPKEQAPARFLLRPTSPIGALALGTSRLRAVSPIGRPSPKRCFLL